MRLKIRKMNRQKLGRTPRIRKEIRFLQEFFYSQLITT